MEQNELGRGRLLDPLAQEIDQGLDSTLRPKRLAEFVGQESLKEHLGILLDAARRRGEVPDHVLFAGPPGLGKTTMAGVVAYELGVRLRITSGPVLARGGDLAAQLNDLEAGDVLFIDEIHRLPRAVEEVLYPAMEDFELDIALGKGPAARSIRLGLPRFMLIGATTRSGLVSAPLRDRFGYIAKLDFYRHEELELIITRSARITGTKLGPGGAAEIARRSRGTPRIANRLLRRVGDFALVRGNGIIDAEVAKQALDLYGVDHLGLDKVDRAILELLCAKFRGGPVGIGTIAAAIGEEPETIETVYEPYLLQLGMLMRTPRGRVAGPKAFEHLGMEEPSAGQLPLD